VKNASREKKNERHAFKNFLRASFLGAEGRRSIFEGLHSRRSLRREQRRKGLSEDDEGSALADSPSVRILRRDNVKRMRQTERHTDGGTAHPHRRVSAGGSIFL